MSRREHSYHTGIVWTGNRGTGTADYTSYEREYLITADGKPNMKGSSDPTFRGDPGLYNPEELFLISITSCHMLWYLHLCAKNNIIVEQYGDHAEAIMEEEGDKGGKFISVILKPKILVRKDSDLALAKELHNEAHQKCFIANSCNVPVLIESEIKEAD